MRESNLYIFTNIFPKIRNFNYFYILKTIILVRIVSKCLEKDLENMKVVQITKKQK